jgi:hypothetical protein
MEGKRDAWRVLMSASEAKIPFRKPICRLEGKVDKCVDNRENEDVNGLICLRIQSNNAGLLQTR